MTNCLPHAQFKYTYFHLDTCNYFHTWSLYMSRPWSCHGEPPRIYSLLFRWSKSGDTCGDIWNQHSEEGNRVYWALDYPTVKMNISNFPSDCDQWNGFNIKQQWFWIFKKYIAYHANLKISICPVGNVKCEVPTWSWHLDNCPCLFYFYYNGGNVEW